MHIFADKAGQILATAGGTKVPEAPEGTAIGLDFDESTNPGLARLVGEQTEWPNIVVSERGILWHDKEIPIAAEGDAVKQRKELQARVDRLYGESGPLADDDLRVLLQRLTPRVI